MKINNNKGFTLVELIVVIVILVILGTIAYISLSNYSKVSRDSTRISDIKSIRTSLGLFSLRSGKYPLPDNFFEVSYSGELLRSQGTIGDNVFVNLSDNLNKKPVDPLLGIEYVYSITNKGNEYEIMGLYEKELSFNNTKLILEEVVALDNFYPQIVGDYNGLFVMTSNFLFPTPSIINGNIFKNTDFNSNSSLLSSQVVTGGDNIPDLGIPQIESVTGTLDINLVVGKSVNDDSSNEDKILAIENIQDAFSGSSIDNNDLYGVLLTRETAEKKLELAGWIFGGDFNIPNEVYEEVEDTTAPIISNSLPSGIVTFSPIDISVVTNETSSCKYDIINTDYESMLNTFDTIDNLTHTDSYVLETIDTTYDLYVLCRDLNNNDSQTANIHFTYTNSDEVEIQFVEDDGESYTCESCF